MFKTINEELLKLSSLNANGWKWLNFNEVLGFVLKMQEDFEKQLEDAKAQGFREAVKEMDKMK